MASVAEAHIPLIWSPQPGPQAAFVNCPVFEVVYGGARGGGKTDASLGDFAIHASEHGRDAKGLFVRRTRTALEPTIERAKIIYGPLGAVWQEQKSRFQFPNGAVLYFKHLDNDADADLYQGHDYTRVYVEEMTQFPSSAPIDKLKATLRSAAGVPTGFRATCNPGGPGHNWVKARYIDIGPYNIVEDWFTNPFDGKRIRRSRVFVPARLSDNPALLDNDPLYVANLQLVGSAALVKAWLEGDWNVVEGAFFDNWTAYRNICRPFEIPRLWTRFRSFDWGSAKPFSVQWWAVASDSIVVKSISDHDMWIRRGALVQYREWYGWNGKPNEGLKLTNRQIGKGIKEREAGEKISDSVADPSIFSFAGGPTIAEELYKEKVRFRRADNKRVPGRGAMSGWQQMRERITGDEEGAQLLVFSTCTNFIRTVPVLQHDERNPEDLDTSAEDHAADAARYACMSRPYTAPKPSPPPETRGVTNMTFDEIYALHKKRRGALTLESPL